MLVSPSVDRSASGWIRLGCPLYMAWFADFESGSPIPISYKKVQRALRERREVVSSEPDFNVIAKRLIC